MWPKRSRQDVVTYTCILQKVHVIAIGKEPKTLIFCNIVCIKSNKEIIYSRPLSTLPMLLLSYKSQGFEVFGKTSKPCHVGIHQIALAEYSQMGTNEFQSFLRFFVSFCLGQIKLATSSPRVEWKSATWYSVLHIPNCHFICDWWGQSMLHQHLKFRKN